MPVPYLTKLSKETGKSVNELEKLWDEAKKVASEHFNKPESEFGNTEFAYVVGIVKKMAGVKEAFDWKNAARKLKGQALAFIKGYLIVGNSRFELKALYEDYGITLAVFYCSDATGNGEEKYVVLEYWEDSNKIREYGDYYVHHPNCVWVFDSEFEVQQYIKKEWSDCTLLSLQAHHADFISDAKYLFECAPLNIKLAKDIKIPGKNIILEANDVIKSVFRKTESNDVFVKKELEKFVQLVCKKTGWTADDSYKKDWIVIFDGSENMVRSSSMLRSYPEKIWQSLGLQKQYDDFRETMGEKAIGMETSTNGYHYIVLTLWEDDFGYDPDDDYLRN